jgi:carotenoid cleavage dioxygenase-like enzyme
MGLLQLLLEKVDDLLAATSDPNNKYLNGVFAPVQETAETIECVVEGQLPACIQGQVNKSKPNMNRSIHVELSTEIAKL